MQLSFIINPISGGKSKENFLRNVGLYCEKYRVKDDYFHISGDDDVNKSKAEIVPAGVNFISTRDNIFVKGN